MSFPYPFPFWVVTEQKGNEVRRLLYRWTECPPKTFSRYSLFLCWNGTLISQPTYLCFMHCRNKKRTNCPSVRGFLVCSFSSFVDQV